MITDLSQRILHLPPSTVSNTEYAGKENGQEQKPRFRGNRNVLVQLREKTKDIVNLRTMSVLTWHLATKLCHCRSTTGAINAQFCDKMQFCCWSKSQSAYEDCSEV